MEAGRAHAAIATLHAGFDSELASAGIQIQKQNSRIRLARVETGLLSRSIPIGTQIQARTRRSIHQKDTEP